MSFQQNLQSLLVLLAFMIDLGYSESNMFCKPLNTQISITEMGNIINITSPDYPTSTYTFASTHCDISMRITLSQMAVLLIWRHGVVSPSCAIDYLLLDSELQSLPTYHRCAQLQDGNTSQLIDVLLGNRVNVTSTVYLRLPRFEAERNRFSLNLTILPLYAMRSDGKSYTKSLDSAPTGYISSHARFSSHYGADLKNFLRFANIPSNTTEVVFDFVYLNIGNGRSRSGCNLTQVDVLRIHRTKPDGFQDQLYEICDLDAVSLLDSLTVNLTQFPATALLLEFLTNDRESFDGFLLKYYVVLQTTTMPNTASVTTTTITTKPTSKITKSSSTTSTSASTTAVATSTRRTNITGIQLTTTKTFDVPNVFFEEEINIIAVAAGGGGLILIIIIIILCCVICKRNRTRHKVKEAYVDAVELESRFPRPTSASQRNRSDTNIGNEYSSGELDVPVHYADVGDSTYYSEVDIMPTSSQEGDNRNHNGKSVEPPAIGKLGVQKFRPVDVNTPIEEKVEMFDNDLYASRDAYNSDQSSGSENEE